MATQVIHFTLKFAIDEGKLAEFEGMARKMTAESKKEPGTIGYEWYFSKDRKQCRLLESYATPEAVLAHLNGPVVQELVPKIQAFSSIYSFEVYGTPGPKGAEILAKRRVEIFDHWYGLENLHGHGQES
jgi:quinol monooxygenase YgiN